jgi:uncharacterized RDD family membrane protein YckC
VRESRTRTILTPERVEIHLEAAGLGRRFIGLVVDLALVGGAAGIVQRLAAAILPDFIGAVAGALALLVLTWGYHVYFEVLHQGRPPGKRVAGIRVVDDRGLPLSVEQSFVRNVVRVLDALPLGYAVGAVTALLDPQRRRLGDLVASTLVVRETTPVAYDRRTARARTFNSLRTPRVARLARHRLSLEEREFLSVLCLRAEGLEERARFELMEAVGRHYRERLGIEDANLSGESVVRGLAAVLFC